MNNIYLYTKGCSVCLAAKLDWLLASSQTSCIQLMLFFILNTTFFVE